MGWLTMSRHSMGGHATAKGYLDDQFTYERDHPEGGTRGLKVLASSCPANRVYYAAAQVTRDGIGGEVFAIVCLVLWNPRSASGENFGNKDMTENMGPCEAACPAAILDLLTPTTNEHALDWRRRCREALARRSRKIETGARIKLPAPVRFSDGHVGEEFIVDRIGRRVILRDPETRMPYRIGRFMDQAWTIVPETKVHKTLFA